MKKTLAVIVVALLVVSTISYAVKAESPEKTIDINGLAICELVFARKDYRVRRPPIFAQQESVFIYLWMTLKGHKLGERYRYSIKFRVRIINPFNLPIFDKTVEESFNSTEPVEEYIWWECVDLILTLLVFNGKYRVVVEVEDQINRYTTSAENYFYVKNANSRTLIFDLKIDFIVGNLGKDPLPINVMCIAIPETIEPYQELLSQVELTPKPQKYIRDKYGTLYAVYKDLTVPPETNATFTMKFKVKLKALEFSLNKIDRSLLKNIPSNLQEFLKPSPEIESDADEIVETAKKLVEGVDDVVYMAYKIVNFTANYLCYAVVPENRSALWAFKNRAGDCTQFSRLCVALARAAGIPAKPVAGILIVKTPFIENTGLHAWAELYLPGFGWLPVEPQSPETFGYMLPYYIVTCRGYEGYFEVDGCKLPTSIASISYEGFDVILDLDYMYNVTSLEEKFEESWIKAEVKPESIMSGEEITVTIHTLPELAGEKAVIYLETPDKKLKTVLVPIKEGGLGEVSIRLDRAGVWKIWCIVGGRYYFPSSTQVFEVSVAKKKLKEFKATIPSVITIGEKVEIKGHMVPQLDTIVTIRAKSPSKELTEIKVSVLKGDFTAPIVFNESGKWIVEVYWPGNEEYYEATVVLEVDVTKRNSSIELSYPKEVAKGKEIIIKGALSPPIKGTKVFLKIVSPTGKITVLNTTVSEGGVFEFIFTASEVGEYKISAYWLGTEVYKDCSTTSKIIVKEEFPVVVLVAALLVVVAIIAGIVYWKKLKKTS